MRTFFNPAGRKSGIKPRKVVKLKPNYPGKPGPKPKQIDWKLVRNLARVACTPAEIASMLEISEPTLTGREEFFGIYKEGIEAGNASLRRMQWKAAQDGQGVMLIWLGKQRLGQAERNVMQLQGPGGGAIELVSKTKPDFSRLSLEELEMLAALMDKAAVAAIKPKELEEVKK